MVRTNQQTEQNPEVSPASRQINETIHLINRHKGLMAAVFAAVLTVAFLYVSYQITIWRVVAKVDIGAGMRMPLTDVYRQSGSSYERSQVAILASDTLRTNVLRRLALEGWMQVMPSKDLLPGIKIDTVGSTSIIELKVDSPYPEYATAYAQTLLDEFIIFKSEKKSESAEMANSQIANQLTQFKAELDAGEQKLLSYKKHNDIVLYDEAGNIPARYAADLQMRLNNLITQRSILENQLAVLKNNRDPYLIESTLLSVFSGQTTGSMYPSNSSRKEPGSGTPTIIKNQQGTLPSVYLLAEGEVRNYQTLKTQAQQLKERLASQISIYKEDHPQIIALKNRLTEAENQLQNEIDNLYQRLNARYQNLKLEQSAIEKSLHEWENKAGSVSVRSMAYDNLQLQVDQTRKIYNTLLQRQNEIEASSGIEEAKVIQVIERPHLLPVPVAPKKTKTLMIAFVMALGLGLATSFTIEYLDDTIRNSEELQNYVGLPTLAVIPKYQPWEDKSASDRLIQMGEGFSPILEAFRNLRTSITVSSTQKKIQNILVASSAANEGKTIVSVNLAISLAKLGERILLIDTDLRKGTSHRFFNLSRETGLSEYLLGKITEPGEIIKQTDIQNLSAITSGGHPDNPPELLSSQRFKDLLTDLRTKYDRIIIDGPPVITVTDGVIVSALVDGVIMVIWGGETPAVLVNRSLKLLENSGGRVIGGVINRLEQRDFDYYSYRYYHYYYGYHYQPKKQNQQVE